MEQKGTVGNLLGIVPGLALMVATFLFAQWAEGALKPLEVFGYKEFFGRVLNLNYIIISIVMGVLYRNVLFGGKIPGFLADGFRTTRLFIKTGVIMLGSIYTLGGLAKLGAMAAGLITGFVFATVIFVMWLGKRLGMDRSLVGVMCAACGVCGVSAAVATSPGVRAKPAEVALAIATILGFGVMTMFLSPYLGNLLQLSDYQYGVWVGTGILNSGQVLAACLAFNPVIAPGTALAYGEAWNVMRVIIIPFVVFVITIWYWSGNKEEAGGQNVSLWEILKSKFPIFVLGFVGMTALSSIGLLGQEGSETSALLRTFMQWIFGIGMVGLGAYIDFGEIKAAGGKPLIVGLSAGTLKYVLALIMALTIIPKTGPF
jgi:uncharacterized integral membrane protein (TIGR00698 family)